MPGKTEEKENKNELLLQSVSIYKFMNIIIQKEIGYI